MNTDKPIVIHTWKSNKLNQDDPKVYFKPVTDSSYNPDDNAKNLARLFSMSLPGNTVDIFYDSIAEGLLHLIDPNLDFADKQHISNVIRIVVNELSE